MEHLNDVNLPIVFSIGPAGTGKTFLACHYAITSYLNGDVNKIIITIITIPIALTPHPIAELLYCRSDLP